MRRGVWMRVVCAAVTLSVSGCASWFLNGAQMHEGVPRQPIARFTIPSCTMANGAPSPGPPGQWYYLVQERRGLVAYEIDASGAGAQITNHWADERGDYFFVWVAGSHGWVYSFPRDRTQLPQRIVYAAGTYQLQQIGGATAPVGTAAGTCTLVPG